MICQREDRCPGQRQIWNLFCGVASAAQGGSCARPEGAGVTPRKQQASTERVAAGRARALQTPLPWEGEAPQPS